MKLRNFLLALVALFGLSCSSGADTFNPETMLQQSVDKVKSVSAKLTDYNKFPRNIPATDTEWVCEDVKGWTSGFYAGVLWLAYEYSQDEFIKDKAMKFTQPLSEIAYTPAEDHDIGFQVYLSYGNGLRLCNEAGYKEVMIAAADTLATLFNPLAGSIHSWPSREDYPHNTIIDNMMNLELLFWAAKNGGSKRLEDIAISHAEVTQKYIVRPDSAVYHVALFDKDGVFQKGVTGQGYANESMWARGQAWGIYGFAIAYREVGRKDFLATSLKLADHFLNRLPEDGIPYWDFDAPNIPDAPKDASAAAVAASGMLELYTLLEDRVLAEKYYDAAVELLANLSTDKYLAGDKNDAILLHSTGHLPKGGEIDIPIIYGDYYYLDALLKLKKINDSRE